jgi:hypothetical protein
MKSPPRIQILNGVFVACAALVCLYALDQFAERVAYVASRYQLKHTDVSYWSLRMTLLAMPGLLAVLSFSSARTAVYGTSIATVWLAMLATASLMISPTNPLWDPPLPLEQGKPLIWGPLSVAAAHWVLCLASKAATSRFVEPYKNWVPLGIGVILLSVAGGVCNRMVGGGWLLGKVSEDLGQSSARLGVYASVGVAVFLRSYFSTADESK